MTKPGEKTRVNLTLTAKEMHELERSKPSQWYNAQWLKHLAFVALRNSESLGVTRRNLALLDVTTPSPARARDTISSPPNSEKDKREREPEPMKATPSPPSRPKPPAVTAAERLESTIEELDWYGAKFPPSSGPKELSRKLVSTYDALDHCQTAKEASAWLFANPGRRKKSASRFLLGWFKNASKPAPWEPKPADNLRERAAIARKQAARDEQQRQLKHKSELDAELALSPEEQAERARVALSFLKPSKG